MRPSESSSIACENEPCLTVRDLGYKALERPVSGFIWPGAAVVKCCGVALCGRCSSVHAEEHRNERTARRNSDADVRRLQKESESDPEDDNKKMAYLAAKIRSGMSSEEERSEYEFLVLKSKFKSGDASDEEVEEYKDLAGLYDCYDCDIVKHKDFLYSFDIGSGSRIISLCEDCLMKREEEDRNNAWDAWLEWDYKRCLKLRFQVEGLELGLDDVDSGDLNELFEATRESSGVEWEGSDVNFRSVAQSTSVSSILSLDGVKINGAPASVETAFPRMIVNALDRVDELTTQSDYGASRVYGQLRPLVPVPPSPTTRRGRAAIRSQIRKTMDRRGGLWASPEERQAIRDYPKTVEGMRRMMVDAVQLGKPRKLSVRSDYLPAVQMPTQQEILQRSRYLSAIRRERNPES